MLHAAIYGDHRGSRALVLDDEAQAQLVVEGPPVTYESYAALGELLSTLSEAVEGGFHRVAVGLEGVPFNREDIIGSVAAALKVKSVAVLSQVHAYFYASTCGGDGVIVASDTGSFAYGVYEGVKAGAGGWGWLFDDEGGAYWVAREGLRRAFLYIDGRSRDGRFLASSILSRLEAADPLSALRILYSRFRDPYAVAGLADIVCSAAEGGDPAALDVVREASFHLASMAESVYKRLGHPKVPVIGVGDFLLGCKILREETSALLLSLGMYLRPMPVDPLVGCTYYLASKLGVKPDCKALAEVARGGA